MHTQPAGPAPELKSHPNPQPNAQPRPKAEPAPEMLIQYPKSEPVAVALPARSLWDDIAAAARNRRSIRLARARHLSEGMAGDEWLPTVRLGSPLSWVAVATGLALLAGFWSAILF